MFGKTIKDLKAARLPPGLQMADEAKRLQRSEVTNENGRGDEGSIETRTQLELFQESDLPWL